MISCFAIRASSWGQRAWSKGLFAHVKTRVSLPRSATLYSQRRPSCSQTEAKSKCQAKSNPTIPPITSSRFWASNPTWRRAALNTTRCLIGCTVGDFSMMWYLQAFYPAMAIGPVMAISMSCGIATSMLLETVLLRVGRDQLSWPVAVKTAAGMSLISMVTMELAENMVDYHLTGGLVRLDSPAFWGAALLSISAGFIAPLPYNYARLRRYGKSCH
ncbi:hypothetical protein IQ07DRAFT_574069 [Pyrenochaeta sp. DS3sAY3a]|nr:hypothetical protein IQ07DRAFT_574069 [Pyrenochaeta sp. DS3sAY3a]